MYFSAHVGNGLIPRVLCYLVCVDVIVEVSVRVERSGFEEAGEPESQLRYHAINDHIGIDAQAEHHVAHEVGAQDVYEL